MSDWPLHIRMRLLTDRFPKIVGPQPIRAHKHCSQHRSEIERSERCGCFYCLQTFAPKEIQEWTDSGATTMCPRRGIDSVTGSACGFSLSRDFLQRMHRRWFDRSYKTKVWIRLPRNVGYNF
jgi:hypothetical protein